jgi:DNA (cytosine-5)-methyltransferase 1
MPKLLDLYCKAGGAGMGYHRAGFEVTGVDIEPQKNYPFKFIQADALDYVAQYGWMYDAIHASPPCQAHSVITPDKSKHVDLIPQTRYWLETIGVPYVIENVGGARKALRSPFMLCGSQFGLKVYRHRLFESNVFIFTLNHQPHHDRGLSAGHSISEKGFISIAGNFQTMRQWNGEGKRPHVYNKIADENGYVTLVGHWTCALDYARYAMGIDWMDKKELTQAIPPAYTEFIGRQLMNAVLNKRPVVEQAVSLVALAA